jgi:hypothetical protein
MRPAVPLRSIGRRPQRSGVRYRRNSGPRPQRKGVAPQRSFGVRLPRKARAVSSRRKA